MKVIESRELSKSYGKIKALDDVTFEIAENKITGLIGRNGAGKTTLLKIIAGYCKPTGGEIKVWQHNPFNSLAVSGNMIFVDDHMVFPVSLSLGDILKEAAVFYPHFAMTLALGLTDYFSLNLQQRYGYLSKGMKSAFNAILGLAARCPLTIYDEPTNGMDSAVRKDFYRALLKDYLEIPRTIVLSSHLLNEVEELLEDILLIDKGRKRLHAPVVELKEYAAGIRGNARAVLEIAGGKEILHQEEFANSLYIVVKDFDREQLDLAGHNGLEVLPVTASDVCVYLTSGRKGGIDDVFKRS